MRGAPLLCGLNEINNKNNNVIHNTRANYVYQASYMSSGHECTDSNIISDYKSRIVNSLGRKLVWLLGFSFLTFKGVCSRVVLCLLQCALCTEPESSKVARR